jgi:hypothetical protein
MYRVVYLLLFLVFWAQLDDVLLPASAFQGGSVVGCDDDEYLPYEHRAERQRVAPCEGPPFARSHAPTAYRCFAPGAVALERGLTMPFTPAPLYAFMSLQI